MPSKRKSSAERKESVYYLCNPERYSESMVNMVRMLSAPQPMKQLKPNEKNPNAADQFRSDHQAEYEKREDRPAPANIQEHNNYPKLDDQLNKKRCAVEVKASATIVAKRSLTNQYYDPQCKLCRELMRQKAGARRNSTRTNLKNTDSRYKKSDHRTGITKSKRHRQLNHKLHRRNRCDCSYCSKHSNKGTCTNLQPKEAETSRKMVDEKIENVYLADNYESNNNSSYDKQSNVCLADNYESNNNSSYDKQSNVYLADNYESNNNSSCDKQSKSRNVSEVFTGSQNSIQSYNSNMYLDQEPMVSP